MTTSENDLDTRRSTEIANTIRAFTEMSSQYGSPNPSHAITWIEAEVVLRPLGKALDEELVRTEVEVVSVVGSIVVVPVVVEIEAGKRYEAEVPI